MLKDGGTSNMADLVSDDSNVSIRIETNKSERELWTKALDESSTRQLYSTYLALRPRYEFVSSFYLDFSDRLREKGLAKEALRVLTCLAELHGEDARELRILGHRLLQIQQAQLAVHVFADVVRIRTEEPQAYRDLGLAYASVGNYQKAADLFVKIIETPWHARFPEVELIALTELNQLITKHAASINTERINKKYLFSVKFDVRVVLTWDADNSDVDLWVTDPLGDVCMYSLRDTRIGGHLSRDFTGGYGPEEFILPRALKGKYKVQVHYYGDRQQNLARSTTIQVELFRNYGGKNETREGVTMRLDGVARVVDVGTITVN
jgi:tetratricopeptide (TPR) repeat protein